MRINMFAEVLQTFVFYMFIIRTWAGNTMILLRGVASKLSLLGHHGCCLVLSSPPQAMAVIPYLNLDTHEAMMVDSILWLKPDRSLGAMHT